MQEANVIVENESGMHSKVVSEFISFVNKYKCKVSIVREDRVVNAKSILNLLAMGIHYGENVTVRTDGIDEDKALKGIVDFFQCSKEKDS